jgi:deoxyribodipyrimidine photolyase-related protein
VKKRILRLILGDQLNVQHSWFSEGPDVAEYLLMEVREEATYARHHIQKIIGFFLAMRAFAKELEARGLTVRYLALDDSSNQHSFTANVQALLSSGNYSSFEYQAPDEYRVAEALKDISARVSVPTRVVDSEHFLTTPEFFQGVFKGHKRYVMELFYREVRRKYDILMEDGGPIGGRWNYDAENRKKLPKGVTPPPPLEFERDVTDIVALLKSENVPSIGSVDPCRFTWPVTREESLRVLRYFCEQLLPEFGSYQDAMHSDHHFLFHSRLSFSMNVKLLSPLEVVEAAIEAWRESKGSISVEQIEGFVRQIAGWREFMRGVYWAHMPRYKTLNFLNADRPLPHYFWDADTKMRCVKHAVGQSLEEAYAHHIQRLMITGNFTILAGIDPDEVDAWYLGIYADALEWVQLPNTRGMSQFADGGIVGTKPYTSSAAYINKMSNYCSGCFYNFKERYGERGCPFNTLYWDFLIRHRKLLEKNPRIGMGYRHIDKMSKEELAEISAKASEILDGIEKL